MRKNLKARAPRKSRGTAKGKSRRKIAEKVTIEDREEISDATGRQAGVFSFDQELIVNKDQVKGRIKEAKGNVKEVAGKMVGNESLELKGKVQKAVGKVQAGYGDLKDDLKKSS
jgi:uncharacterized protein YjbJ (UPF0337 family)